MELPFKYDFVPGDILPANQPVSNPATFAFIGENLVLTRQKSHQWNILGGEIKEGETWTEALKRNSLEEAGVVIDHIAVVGYLSVSESNSIVPVTVSFVKEVKKAWQKDVTLEREHFSRKWAKRALLDRGKLAEIFDYVLSWYSAQKYDYSFDYVEADISLPKVQNTNAMVFVKTKENNFLIVRDFDETFFSLPGGGCGMDEDGKDCAIREVREEAQVGVKNVRLIGNLLVEVCKDGKVLSTSTQQRYLADVAKMSDFVDQGHFNEKDSETVERKEVPLELLRLEVKQLAYKSGECILSNVKRLL